LFRMFTAKVPHLINVYVCIMHMVGSISAAGKQARTDKI
jgi:hypothetical protein